MDAVDGVMVRYRRATGRPLDSSRSTKYVLPALYTTRSGSACAHIRAQMKIRVIFGFSNGNSKGGPIAGIGKMAAAAHVGCVSPEVGVDVARCGMICAPRDAAVGELG